MTMRQHTRTIDELEEDMEDLRLIHYHLANASKLNEVLRPQGVEVLEYEGPARYELGRTPLCEICGEPIDASQLAYELRLMSAAWGPRYGYLHRRCFDRAVKDEDPVMVSLESYIGEQA